jgi:hypothetical protein
VLDQSQVARVVGTACGRTPALPRDQRRKHLGFTEQTALQKFLAILFSCLPAFRQSAYSGAGRRLHTRRSGALELDCGPTSGFDPAKVIAEFFPDGKCKVSFLCNPGYGDQSKLSPRHPASRIRRGMPGAVKGRRRRSEPRLYQENLRSRFLLGLFLDLGPAIFQRHGAVKHGLSRLGIHAKISQAFELIPAFDWRIG